jgi:hypothetical protein
MKGMRKNKHVLFENTSRIPRNGMQSDLELGISINQSWGCHPKRPRTKATSHRLASDYQMGDISSFQLSKAPSVGRDFAGLDLKIIQRLCYESGYSSLPLQMMSVV